MSRGAIQHGIPADSSCLQIVSAIELSLLEWLIKTTGDPRRIRNDSQQELRELLRPARTEPLGIATVSFTLFPREVALIPFLCDQAISSLES
jgi:hypothetical protein